MGSHGRGRARASGAGASAPPGAGVGACPLVLRGRALCFWGWEDCLVSTVCGACKILARLGFFFFEEQRARRSKDRGTWEFLERCVTLANLKGASSFKGVCYL